MNPIQAPQNIGAEVNRGHASPVPVFVDVIAQVLDFLGHLMCANGLVLAASYLNVRRTEIPRVGTDPIERNSMEMQQVRQAEPERSIRMSEIFNHLNHGIEL